MDDRRELGSGSRISFLGAAFSAAMGFVLVLVLGRSLGDAGAGVVFQAIAVFSIALAIGRAGMDSAAIWLLPRLAVDRNPALSPSAWGMVAVSGAAGLLSMLAVIWYANSFAAEGSEVAAATVAVALALPFGAMLLTALSATRALGGVAPYVLVGNTLLPGLRPVLVLGAVALGWSALGASAAWAVPVIPACVLACAVLFVRLRRSAASTSSVPAVRGSSGIPGRVAKYAAPRLVSAVFEQLLVWGGVLVVGLLASSADAGVYAAASRFIAAGMIIDTALRVVVAPMFSRLQHRGDAARTGAVLRTATVWLVLFSGPIFIMIAVFSPVALSLFGPEFVRGATVLSVMSIGALMILLAGNIHSVLLMGGRSGWAAANKIIAVTANLGLIAVLMPTFGLIGAAWAWVIAGALDAALAAVQVRLLLRVPLPFIAGFRSLAVVAVTVGIPALLARLLIGPVWLAVAAALAVGAPAFSVWCRLDRSRLELDALPVRARARRQSSLRETVPEHV